MKGRRTALLPAAMMHFWKRMTFLPPVFSWPVAGGEFDLEVVGVEEMAVAAHDVHLARLGHAGEAAGELGDHLRLVRAQLVEVEFWARRSHAAVIGHVRRFLHHRGDVQQRLGGDAADVEADAAQRGVAFDEHGLQAEVGGAEGGGVAAGAGAEDEHVGFDVAPPEAVRQQPGAGERAGGHGDRQAERVSGRGRAGTARAGARRYLQQQHQRALG
jgi:hypothetical protein